MSLWKEVPHAILEWIIAALGCVALGMLILLPFMPEQHALIRDGVFCAAILLLALKLKV